MIETKSTNKDFHCFLTNGRLTFDSDAPIFKGGLGNGLRPHELLEAALALCINLTIRTIAKEKGIEPGNVSTVVELDRSGSKTTFKYKINLDTKLNEDEKKFFLNIIDLCAVVKHTLSKQLEFLQLHD